jgi:Domain of unknown function (DUF4397)
MKRPTLSVVGPVIGLVAGLTLVAPPAAAYADGSSQPGSQPAWGQWGPGQRAEPDLSLVHGVPGLAVDIYVDKDVFSVKKLSDVTFGTAVDLDAAFPGWVTPGFYAVDVVPTGTSALHPLLITRFALGWGQAKTVAAYVTAAATGTAGPPTLGVFDNDLSSTSGAARVTVRHLAVAPSVGVYADSSVAITPASSNGQTATAVVPAGSYDVTVTAPGTPATVLYDVGSVALAANTNTLAFAIGAYPSTFKVVALAVPTR